MPSFRLFMIFQAQQLRLHKLDHADNVF